ncbi:MAG: hypothetical protein HQ402_00165 [Parcubacteria group bacterium]|nr:hypothetical protein [Parcubacteria group bacterium]
MIATVNKKKTGRIVKGDLHFTTTSDGQFLCRELTELPTLFENRWDEGEIMAEIKEYHAMMVKHFFLRQPADFEGDRRSSEFLDQGQPVINRIISEVSGKQATLFHELLFTMSDHWWYYHPEINEKLFADRNKLWDEKRAADGVLVNKYIKPLLPEQVRQSVQNMKMIGVDVGFGHFGFYFADDSGVRRIVTDTQLVELREVRGYNYLAMTPDGKPFVRCCTPHGGERAFFDGFRLMSHNRFQTCAPKQVFFDGGYKVNSTQVSIVNGVLFDLIENDDAVAQTTGAFMGMCDFTGKDMMKSVELSEQTAKQLRVTRGRVFLGDRELKPVGRFNPSRVTLLDSGFSLYSWSDFEEIFVCRYDSVLVIDDSADWISAVKHEFRGEISSLRTFRTKSRVSALKRIMTLQPEALILDMHLTPEEGFNGLWIANQLISHGFKGLILIASSYHDEQLQAMQKLIKGKTKAPGKNLARIRQCLCK